MKQPARFSVLSCGGDLAQNASPILGGAHSLGSERWAGAIAPERRVTNVTPIISAKV
jgi:hypothetical protein